jgi:hypothetical protein
VSRTLLIGLAAERLAEAATEQGWWRDDEPGPVATLNDRLALLEAQRPSLGPGSIEAVRGELGGLTVAEEGELNQAWRYYLARKEVE